MKTIKLSLVIACIILLGSCKKDVCTVCSYTQTGVHSETGEQVFYESGTYKENEMEAGCEMTKEEFEASINNQLQESCDYQNAIEHMELDMTTMEIVLHQEIWTYTLSCD